MKNREKEEEEQEWEEQEEEGGRKCLWRHRSDREDDDEDDSVTDERTFLRSLRVAAPVGRVRARYGAAVCGALAVGERVAVVCAFAGLFVALRRGTVSAARVLGVDALLCAVLLALAARARAAPALRPLAAAGASTLALAPGLQSLTAAVASDSVYLAATLLLALHAAAYNYDRRGAPSVVALNAALFASVLLASRLAHRPARAAAFLLYAALVFGVLPAARPHAARTPAAAAAVLALLSLCNALLWGPAHPAALVLYAALVAAVTLVAPLGLVLVQPYKRFVARSCFSSLTLLMLLMVVMLLLHRDLRGDWDEAVPVLDSTADEM